MRDLPGFAAAAPPPAARLRREPARTPGRPFPARCRVVPVLYLKGRVPCAIFKLLNYEVLSRHVFMGFQGRQNVLQKIRSDHKVLSPIAIRGFPLPPLVTLVLTMGGLFAVLTMAVGQRRRELAIRHRPHDAATPGGRRSRLGATRVSRYRRRGAKPLEPPPLPRSVGSATPQVFPQQVDAPSAPARARSDPRDPHGGDGWPTPASGGPVLALGAVAPRPVALPDAWAGSHVLHGRGGNGRRPVRPRRESQVRQTERALSDPGATRRPRRR